jgi:hypothetical protein
MLSTTEIFRPPDVSVHGALHASDDALGTKSDANYTQDYETCVVTLANKLVGAAPGPAATGNAWNYPASGLVSV